MGSSFSRFSTTYSYLAARGGYASIKKGMVSYFTHVGDDRDLPPIAVSLDQEKTLG